MIKELNYETCGNGNNVVLLLHGWGVDKNVFNKIIPIISKKAKVISLDFFGFGKSDNPESWFDTYEYAMLIFEFLNELKINEIIIVGHSFGGRVAIILSSIFNIKVKNLILSSSAGVKLFSIRKFFKIIHYKIAKKLIKYKILKGSCLKKFGSDDFKNLSRVDKNVFVRIVNNDLKYLLTQIVCDTLLVWDKKDKVTKYAECKVMKKYIKKSSIVAFKTGGHFTFLTNSNKFACLIMSCL